MTALCAHCRIRVAHWNDGDDQPICAPCIHEREGRPIHIELACGCVFDNGAQTKACSTPHFSPVCPRCKGAHGDIRGHRLVLVTEDGLCTACALDRRTP